MWTFILSHESAFEDLERDFCVFILWFHINYWITWANFFPPQQHAKPPKYSREQSRPKVVATENLCYQKKKVYLTCTVTVKKQAKILTLVETAPIYLKFTSVLLDIIWAYWLNCNLLKFWLRAAFRSILIYFIIWFKKMHA